MDKIKLLEKEIARHRNLYYNEQPEISDAEFDALVQDLEWLDPSNPVLREVGAAPSKKREAKLDHPMGSLDKKSDPQDLIDWFNKYHIYDVIIEEKLDGASLEVRYVNGELDRLTTRGDGKVGRDATHHAKAMIGLPQTIAASGKTWVRGEVNITTSDFEKQNSKVPDKDKHANPRNLASGTLNADEPYPERKLRFVACSVIGLENEFEHQDLKALTKMGFNVVSHKLVGSAEEALEVFNEYHKHTRKSLDYWIDGMVIKVNAKREHEKIGYLHLNPRFACAMKFPAEEVVTKLNNIEWNLTNHGKLAPRGVLEPVQLAGTTVSYAYLNNINFIKERGIQIGDYIRIKKGGDIIPYVIGLEKKGENRNGLKIPKVCPECSEELTLGDAYISCPNPSCAGKSYGTLRNWIKKIEIDQIGDASLEKIINAHLVKEPADLYGLKECDLIHLLGKIGQTIYNNIQAKRVLKLKDVFGSTMIDGAGRSTFELIIEAGYNSPEKIFALTKDDLVKVNGFSNIKAAQVVGGLKARRKILDNLLQKITLEKTSHKVNSAQSVGRKESKMVEGKSFCITGSLSRTKEEVYSDIEVAGGVRFDSVKKGLDFLIAADPGSGSNKLEKATKMGIKVISEEDLLKMLK